MSTKQLLTAVLVTVLTATAHHTHATPIQTSSADSSFWQTVKRDHLNFYTRDRLTRLGIAFGIGAVMANSHIDQGIRDWYQDQIRTPKSDNFAKTVKNFGYGYYMIPASLLALGIGQLSTESDRSVIGAWGQRSFRAYLVGAPVLLVAQQATGGSRPQERADASHWRPFQDSNGVSGHAFIGAVPFLTIADMTDNRYVRYSAYVASTLAGWSRINDDAHFASQVFLGWYMAYQATDAVSNNEAAAQQHDTHLAILPWPHGVLVALDYRW